MPETVPKKQTIKCPLFPTLDIDCDVPSAIVCSGRRKVKDDEGCSIKELLKTVYIELETLPND